MPMKRVPFPLETYEHPSKPLSAKRLVNLYAEQEPSDARVAGALIPTPGLTVFNQFGAGPIQAINADLGGSVYVVSADHAYRLSFPPRPNYGVEDLGYVGTVGRGYDEVTIAVSPTAAVICVPPRAYTCGHNGTGAIGGDPMHEVGGDFPGAASVAYLDGYFIFSAYEDNAKWFINELWDPDSFDALDFVFADAVPNIVNRILTRAGQVWVMGIYAHEVWYDAGNADFPFRRIPGGVVTPGTSAARSLAIVDDSIWWLGNDGIVYRTNGYNAMRVSTHAIEEIIRETDFGVKVNNSDGFGYKFRGHSFYCLRLGNERTLTYNCATKVWHEQSSTLTTAGAWRIRCAALFRGGEYIMGDNLSGWTFQLDHGVADGDLPVTRLATLPPLWAETNRAFCSRLEVEMEVGTAISNGDFMLEWSDDGGWTWTGRRPMNAGAINQTRKRVVATRLGSFRQRVYRITTQKAATVYAVDADIAPGAS